MLGFLEALVAQEGQQDLVCQNLGFLVSLALQDGLEGRQLTLLWVPETCQKEVAESSFCHKDDMSVYPWNADSPQVLVSQGYLVARATLPPLCLPSPLGCPVHLSAPDITMQTNKTHITHTHKT